MSVVARNRHAGAPFTDGDERIAAVLEEVSVPVLLCALVHMTGDPSWVRGEWRPHGMILFDLQGAMTPEERAEVRRRAVPVIAAYRDGGCVPHPVSDELVEEMMAFLARHQVDESIAALMVEEMELDGADHRAVGWGDEVREEVKADSPVVVIGCGMSGILAGIRLAEAGLPFTIVDKNDGPGGTWWENRYPGARVDVFSHSYSYSFEPGDHWSEYFCQQPELRDYFVRVLHKYGLGPYCRFGTAVTAARWDEATARWRVTVRSGDGLEEVLEARFVISAVGSLNIPRMPDIPGVDDFTGPSFHSTRWPDGVDIAGTRFALLGAGASGFQIAPTIAGRVGQLDIYQRTAQWMLPNPLYHERVPPGEQWAMRHLPFYGRWFRFVTAYPGIAAGTRPYKLDAGFDDPTGTAINAANAKRRDALVQWITSNLAGRPDLIEKSLPDYPAMGKRILQDNGSWLRTLRRDNVELVRTPIERIVAHGVVTVDGKVREADVICYATGFSHNEFLGSFEVTGRGGVSLREQWGDEPSAYLGITIPNFPNLFCVYGPGTNLAHGTSLFFHSECQIRYAMDGIHRVLSAGARTIDVRRDVHDDYVARYTAEIGQLVWAHPSIAHSHYKNPQGRIFTLSPWPLEVYWAWTRQVDPADYVIA